MVEENANLSVLGLLVAECIFHLGLASISSAGEVVVSHGNSNVAVQLDLVVVKPWKCIEDTWKIYELSLQWWVSQCEKTTWARGPKNKTFCGRPEYSKPFGWPIWQPNAKRRWHINSYIYIYIYIYI